MWSRRSNNSTVALSMAWMIRYSISGNSADTSDMLVGNVTLVSSWLDGEAYASTDPRRILDERLRTLSFENLAKEPIG